MRLIGMVVLCLMLVFFTACSQTPDPLLDGDSLVPMDLYFSSGDDGIRYYHLQIRAHENIFYAVETITDNYSDLHEKDSLPVLNESQIKVLKAFVNENLAADFSHCDHSTSLKQELIIQYNEQQVIIEDYCPVGKQYEELRNYLFHTIK